ncbi:MAG: DUF2207 domain-containing protein, partial [Candidatus ainarchaeum sp.]|nr:DUF2207 domain-containing protein [Candidatus ainarchaeum sp.]
MKGKILFAIVIAALAFSSAAFSASGSFSIPRASVDYYLNPDGTVYVQENITYVLDGSFTELYLQKPPDLAIVNASGYCEQKDCSFYTQMNNGWRELVLRGNYSHEMVNAVFTYTLEGQVLEQKDCAQFFYKLWGDQWQESIGVLHATVHLPGNASQTQYFVHPPYGSITNYTGTNSISVVSLDHPAQTYLEINMVMPGEWFSSLRKAPNYMSKAEIVKGEQDYINGENLRHTIFLFMLYGLVAVLPVAFILLYLIYGREKPLSQLEYLAPYEREPPDDLSPAQAAYLVSRNAGPNGISAEILWLVQQKYLRMEETEIETGSFLFKGRKKTAVFYLNEGKKLDGLKPHQRMLYDFIAANLSLKGYFYIEYLNGDAGARQAYAEFYPKFQGKVGEWFRKKGYLDEKGNKIFTVVA